MKKRTIAILLLLALCTALFAGCGSSETVAPAPASGGSAAPDSGSGSAAGTQPAADAGDEDEAEINVALMALAPIDKNASEAVVEKVNEYTEKDLNIHVNITWYDAANYGTQIPMQIQGSEKLDVIMFTPVPGSSYSSYRTANQLMDISGLLQQYGQTILKTEGDLIRGTSYGDAIYGITHYSSKTGYMCMYVRKDLADASGVTEALENATTFTEVEEAFKKMTADHGMPALINSDAEGTVLYPKPFLVSGEKFSEAFWCDAIGDGNNLVVVDPATKKVACIFNTDYYENMCERVHRWYSEGLVYKDAAFTQEYGDTLVKSGVGYCHVRAAELGTKINSEGTTGYELIEIQVTPSDIGTSSCTKFGYCVPVTSTEPEAAVRFLNYLYENADVLNTLTWGVEGRDWVCNADGLATYPEGESEATVAYHTGDFLYGNQMMIIPWEGSPVDIRQQQQAIMDTAVVSPYMGFTLSNEGLENTVTACVTARKQYEAQLNAGVLDNWQEELETFRSALKAAGIDELVAAYQAQLDAWLADNQ